MLDSESQPQHFLCMQSSLGMPPPGPLTPPDTPNDDRHTAFGAYYMAVSPSFCPEAQLDPSCAPDLVVISSDCMLFYVHSKLLLYVSTNAFSGLLPAPSGADLGLTTPVVRVQSDSIVLDLVLRAIYGLDMAAGKPSLDMLSLAVDALLVCYAIPPLFVLSPGRSLFEAILAHAAVHPLHVYTLAARYAGADALAVAASAHMLSYPLALLTDAEAHAMGAVYLRRLFFMQMGRVAALKRLLLVPPAAHAPTSQCDTVDHQPKVQRAWALATAAILLDARADTPAHALEGALRPLLTHIWCSDCRRMLSERTQKLVAEWSAIKKTI